LLAVLADSRNTALERGFALIALSQCRSEPVDLVVDHALRDVLSAARSTPRELLLCALLHQKLARIEHLWPATLALALDERAPPSVRAPALEALAGSRRFVDASALIDALHAPREVLRRSAALALGEVRDDRTTQALIDLLERENDPLTRGFASLSLGRQAQPAGVEVLLAQRLTAGDAQQPWTWLGLGVAARAGNARARAGLLTQARPRARADEQAAQFLAIGLARQVGAFAVLDRGSSTLTSALVRPFAAEGLGLLATTGIVPRSHIRRPFVIKNGRKQVRPFGHCDVAGLSAHGVAIEVDLVELDIAELDHGFYGVDDIILGLPRGIGIGSRRVRWWVGV
jgi:hypothetical protein